MTVQHHLSVSIAGRWLGSLFAAFRSTCSRRRRRCRRRLYRREGFAVRMVPSDGDRAPASRSDHTLMTGTRAAGPLSAFCPKPRRPAGSPSPNSCEIPGSKATSVVAFARIRVARRSGPSKKVLRSARRCPLSHDKTMLLRWSNGDHSSF